MSETKKDGPAGLAKAVEAPKHPAMPTEPEWVERLLALIPPSKQGLSNGKPGRKDQGD